MELQFEIGTCFACATPLVINFVTNFGESNRGSCRTFAEHFVFADWHWNIFCDCFSGDHAKKCISIEKKNKFLLNFICKARKKWENVIIRMLEAKLACNCANVQMYKLYKFINVEIVQMHKRAK